MMGFYKKIKRIIAWTMVSVMIPWSSFVYGDYTLAYSENSSVLNDVSKLNDVDDQIDKSDFEELNITQSYILENDMEISDLILNDEAELDLNGYCLYVHGDILQESGKIIINGGELTVDGNYRMQKATPNEDELSVEDIEYTLSETSLIMTNPEDMVTVSGDFYISSSINSINNLTNGVFTLSGDFYISEDSHKNAFSGTDNFKMILNGEEDQSLDLSGDVSIPIFELNCNGTISSDTTISVNQELISSYEDVYDGIISIGIYTMLTGDGFGGTVESTKWSINADYHIAGDLINNMILFMSGNITVDGDVVCNAGIDIYGNLYIRGSLLSDYYRNFSVECMYDSKLTVEGDVRFSREGAFKIAEGNESEVVIYGDFETHRSGNCEAGTISVGGDFIADGFVGTKKNKVILNGTSLQKIEINEKCRFATLELLNKSSEGVISKEYFDYDSFIMNDTFFRYENEEGISGYTLTKDIETEGDLILRDGVMDLNGHTLTVNGNLIQTKGDLKVNNGRLIVKGDYRQQNKVGDSYGAGSARLIMINDEDYVEVQKNLIINTYASNQNNQTKGKLSLWGNLEFYSDANSTGFCPTDSFNLMLGGQSEQSLNRYKVKKEYYDHTEYSNETLEIPVLRIDDSVKKLTLSGSDLKITKMLDIKDTDMMVKVSLAAGSEIIGEVYNGNLYVETKLTDDIEINGNLEGAPTLSGKIIVNGKADLYSLIMNRGFLEVTGNLTVGNLYMTHEEDRVRVHGSFNKKTWGYDKNEITDGVIEIGGDFDCSRDPNGFICKGNHKTYMIPDYNLYKSYNKRKVTFGSSTSRTSTFNKLYLSGLRDSYDYDNDIETIANEIIYDYDLPNGIVPIKKIELTELTENTVTFSFVDENNEFVAVYYGIYRNDKYIGFTRTSTYIDKGISPDEYYEYTVSAVDKYGRSSARTEKLTVGTLPDEEPPSTPENLSVSSRSGKSISLMWGESEDNSGVGGYILYRNGEILKEDIKENHFTDIEIEADTVYKYEVSAVDSFGNKSEKSASVSAMAAVPKITRVSPSDYHRIGTDSTELTVFYKNYGGDSKNTIDIEYQNISGEWIRLNDTSLVQNVHNSTEFYSTYELKIDDIKSDINPGSIAIRYIVTDKDGIQDSYETEYEFDTSAPDSPQDVKAEEENGVIILSWSPSPESDFHHYNIYRFIDGENDDRAYSKIATIDYKYDSSLIDSTVQEGKKAWYIVTAVDDMGNESPLINPIDIIVGHDEEVPEIISMLPEQASISGVAEIAVSAKDNKDISEIRFYISDDYDADTSLLSEIGKSVDVEYLEETDIYKTSIYFDTTKFDDGIYYIFAEAYDGAGNTSGTGVYKRYEIDNTGIQKIIITDSRAGSTYVQLMWDDVTEEDFSYFLVEMNETEKSESDWKEATRESGAAGCTIDGLIPEKEYIFRVCGVDKAGNNGEYSDEIKITTMGDSTPPNITAVYPLQGRVNDKINLSMTVKDNYKIERGVWYLSFDGETFSEIESKTGSKSSETIEYTLDISDETEFPEGKIYIKSEAYDTAGNKNQLLSDGSDVVMEYIIDRTAPDIVKNVSSKAGDGYIGVVWESGKEDDIVSYRVYRADTGTGRYIKVMDDTCIDYYDTSIEYGKGYDYYVTAVDEAGNESEASEITASIAKPDETAPNVEGVSPGDKAKIGKNTDFSIIVTDNSSVEKVLTYYRSEDGSEWTLLNESKANGRSAWVKFSYDFSNEEEGTLYFKTVCEDKNRNRSEEKLYSCTLDKTAPNAEIKTTGGNFENYIELTKNGLDMDIAYYEIYRSELSKSGSDMAFYAGAESIQKIPANMSSYTDTDVEPHVAYRYAAKVYDSVGNFSWTEIRNAVATDIDTLAPEIAVPDKLTAITDMEICFDASGSTDNVRIKNFKWDMGNGDIRNGARPRYTYTQSGKYTVKVTCTDASGNSSEKEIEVQVKDADGCGVCELTVTDYNGSPIPYAYVYIKAGSDSDKTMQTDAYGKISLCYKAGTYKVAAFKDGYLPEEKECKIINQKKSESILKLSNGEVVVGSFDVHRMSIQEIVDAGVDLSDPANINTFTFKTTLTFEKSPIPVIVDSISGGYGTGQSYMGGGGFGTPNIPIGWSMDNHAPGGGKGNGVIISVPAKEPIPIFAYISVTQSVSWLKTMYSADLTIMNMAKSTYVLEDSIGSIELPKGVSLAVLGENAKNREATETGQSITIDMGDIPGQTAKTASWILKGDETGTYDINAEYTGMLSPFNIPITKRFTSQTDMQVNSANVVITVMPEMAYYMGEDYYIQYAIKNEGTEPLYNFTTSIGDYRRPPNKEVIYIMDYDTGEITDEKSSGGGMIYTLPKSDQLFSTPVLSGSDCITIPTLLPGQTIYGTWKKGDGGSEAFGFSGDPRKEYFSLVDYLVEVIEGENLGVTVRVEPIKSHISKYIRTSYKEEYVNLRVADPIDAATGAFTESYNALSLSGIDTLDVNLEYDSVLAEYEADEDTRNCGRGWTTNFESYIKEENGLVMYYVNPYIHTAFIAEDLKNGQVRGELEKDNQSENIESDNVTIQMKDYDSENEDIRFVSLSKDMEGYILTRHSDGTYEMESPAGQVMKYDSDGKLSEYVNEKGSKSSFSHDGNETIVEEELSGNRAILTYDNDGHLIRISDGGSRTTSLIYSGDNLAQITDGLGRSLYFEYDEDHRIITEKNNSGEVFITNKYDDEGRVVSQTNSKGQVTSFNYEETESGGVKTTITTSNEGFEDTVKTVTTDYSGRIMNIIDETGREESYQYDAEGRLLSYSDGNGNTQTFDYDEKSNLISHNGMTGNQRLFYDDDSDVTQVSDGRGSFEYTYDENKNLVSSKYNDCETKFTYDEVGKVLSEEKVGKGTESYTWDKGRLTSVTDALGRKTLYEYDAAGNLLKVVSPTGNTFTYEYNAVNQKLSETDANGNKTTYTYNDYNKLKSETDAAGNTITYDYNTAGELIGTTYPDGSKEQYLYDMAGNMTTLINRDGTEIHYEYDSFGNNTSITYPDSTTENFEYDKNGNLIKKTDRKNNVYTYTISNQNQKIAGMEDPYGNNIAYNFDEFGRNTEMVSSQGKEERYTYDNLDNVTSVTDEAGNRTLYNYNKWNELEYTEDALGNRTEFTYDAAGNCTEKKTPEGLDIIYTYDDNNNVIKVETEVQGKHVSESYTYDAMGNILTYTDAMGRITEYTYDMLNRISTETGPDGFKTEYSYDCMGQLTRAESSDGTVTAIVYDNSGNITSVSSNTENIKKSSAKQNGQKYIYGYDTMRRLISVKDPMGFETSQKYDELGNITEITDAMDGTTKYYYDKTSRLVAAEDTLGNRKEFTYDKEGRLLSEKNARGQETVYSYDEYNRLIEIKDDAGTIVYTYDKVGNQLTVTDNSGTIKREYDKLGRVTSVTDSNGKIVKYTYDELGNILSLTYPGGEIVRYDYNLDGSLASVTDGSNNKTSYEYDNGRRLKKTVKPDGSTDENTYNASGRLVQEVQKNSDGEVLMNLEYTYDGSGNIIKIKDHVDFSNDVDYSPESVKADINTDANKAEDKATQVTTSELNMEYDSNNRLIKFNGQEVKYDADGNMTYGPLNGEMTEFTYDSRNRLIKAGDIAYTYDADNIRIGVETSDYKEDYVVDRVSSPTQLLLITRTDKTASARKIESSSCYYGHGLIYEITDGDESDMRVYHFDHNGSTRKITDKAGKLLYSFRYGTYGELLSSCDVSNNSISIDDENLRFLYNGALGVVTDPNGLLYMRQRYYNTDIKRFINQDVLLGDITNSQSLNRYAYVQGNPVSYTDPFGLNPMEFLKKTLMGTLHDMLAIATIIPGIPGAVAGVVNAFLYLSECNFGMAGFSALNALGVLGFSKFGGALAGGIGNLCSKSSLFKTILCSAMIGGGTLMSTTALVTFVSDMEQLSKAIESGADAATIFHLISMSICDGAGVYYGVKTIAGGAMGLTSQCFVAGTTVKTKDGDKPIEEVEAGDMVWSFNPETGEEGLKEVKQTFINETDEIEHIELISDSEKQESGISKDQSLKQANHESIIIDCTPGHPFYVVDYGFKYASELKLGDRVLSQNGSIYIVQKNQKEQLEEPVKVYNFEVEDWHTYCVSEYGVIVHNLCDGESADSGSGTDSSGTNVGKGGSTSNDILDWSITKRKTGETRYDHVKLHEVNDLSKESHGVFYGDSVNTINKAWSNKSNGFKISGERVDTYIIPYENAGYAGGYGGQRQNLNTITIITQKDSNKIITGFPGNGYKYSLDGIIGGD